MKRPGRPNHVIILNENLPVPFDRRPWQIAQTLAQAGTHVSVVCPKMYDYTRRYERFGNIEIYRYTNYEGSTPVGWLIEYTNAMLRMSLLCLWLFVRHGVDAIHACNPPDLLFLVAWPFRVFFGVRFLFDHHDLNPEVYLAKFGRKDWIYRFMRWLEALTYRLADVSLVTNESFRRMAIDRDGADSRKVFVVRNAPQRGRFVPGPPRPEVKEGKNHLIAYLGVMNKQDGLDLLLEAAQHVIHAHGRRDVVFKLIGDGPEVPELKELAERLHLNGEVKFLGRISDGQEISDYLNTATVCVCPDPKNEMNDHSTMTKVVEYMAMGKAIVAYDLKETLCSAGDTAVYACNNDPRHLGDQIVSLLDDPQRCAELGARSKARYEAMLSWEKSQEQLTAAYDKLLGKK